MARPKSFRTIQPDFLLKLGCPSHIYARSMWRRILPEPVCEWGHPVYMEGDCLVVAVQSREYLDAFRSHEDIILRKLKENGLSVGRIRVRLKT